MTKKINATLIYDESQQAPGHVYVEDGPIMLDFIPPVGMLLAVGCHTYEVKMVCYHYDKKNPAMRIWLLELINND